MKLGLARILFVDDEPLLREIFGGWLASEEHWKVSTAADGEDALAMLKADFFDLLITDVRMPRLSGPALVRRLSAMEKTLPSIIFVMLGHGSAIFSISKGASLESLPEYSRACRACRPSTRNEMQASVAHCLSCDLATIRTKVEAPYRVVLRPYTGLEYSN